MDLSTFAAPCVQSSISCLQSDRTSTSLRVIILTNNIKTLNASPICTLTKRVANWSFSLSSNFPSSRQCSDTWQSILDRLGVLQQEHSDPFSTFVFVIVRQMLITAIARVCQRVYYRDPLPITEALSHFVALGVISTRCCTIVLAGYAIQISFTPIAVHSDLSRYLCWTYLLYILDTNMCKVHLLYILIRICVTLGWVSRDWSGEQRTAQLLMLLPLVFCFFSTLHIICFLYIVSMFAHMKLKAYWCSVFFAFVWMPRCLQLDDGLGCSRKCFMTKHYTSCQQKSVPFGEIDELVGC